MSGPEVSVEDYRPAIYRLSLGSSKATLPFLGESSSLSPCPNCDVPAAGVSIGGRGVLGGCESANLTDLAGESSLGDPGIPPNLNDSMRKFLTDPLLESACMESDRGWYEETRSHEVVRDTGMPVPLRRP